MLLGAARSGCVNCRKQSRGRRPQCTTLAPAEAGGRGGNAAWPAPLQGASPCGPSERLVAAVRPVQGSAGRDSVERVCSLPHPRQLLQGGRLPQRVEGSEPPGLQQAGARRRGREPWRRPCVLVLLTAFGKRCERFSRPLPEFRPQHPPPFPLSVACPLPPRAVAADASPRDSGRIGGDRPSRAVASLAAALNAGAATGLATAGDGSGHGRLGVVSCQTRPQRQPRAGAVRPRPRR